MRKTKQTTKIVKQKEKIVANIRKMKMRKEI